MPMACNVANNEAIRPATGTRPTSNQGEIGDTFTQQATGKRGISDVNERHNLSRDIGEQIPPCSGGVIASGVFLLRGALLADV